MTPRAAQGLLGPACSVRCVLQKGQGDGRVPGQAGKQLVAVGSACSVPAHLSLDFLFFFFCETDATSAGKGRRCECLRGKTCCSGLGTSNRAHLQLLCLVLLRHQLTPSVQRVGPQRGCPAGGRGRGSQHKCSRGGASKRCPRHTMSFTATLTGLTGWVPAASCVCRPMHHTVTVGRTHSSTAAQQHQHSSTRTLLNRNLAARTKERSVCPSSSRVSSTGFSPWP